MFQSAAAKDGRSPNYMASLAGVKGLESLLNNMRAKQQQHAAGLQRGLTRAGALLLRYSKEIVPVDFGNLKASGYTRMQPGTGGLTTVVEVGYTADYALYVHEIVSPDATHGEEWNIKHAADLANFKANKHTGNAAATSPYRHNRGANQSAKFLERPMREKVGELRAVVNEELGL